jgi:hypothetical protein
MVRDQFQNEGLTRFHPEGGGLVGIVEKKE